jgi:DNA excision repair protein ERCC-4
MKRTSFPNRVKNDLDDIRGGDGQPSEWAELRERNLAAKAKVQAPFTVVIDSREQTPWGFTGHRADAMQGGGILEVPTVVRGLKSGDYSLDGFEDRLAIERKSPSDLFSTLTFGRDRFERELDRLAELEFSCVVVEGNFDDLVKNPPSGMLPRAFAGSLVALSMRYPSRWYFAGGRSFAEALTLRIFQRWHRDYLDAEKGKPIKGRRSVEAAK